MHEWKVNYGNPRKSDELLTIIVRAETAGKAKDKAREIARKHGFTGRMGMIRLLAKAEAA
jgi:hypothetical protein